MTERPLVLLGSSNSEIFDYLFGHSDSYYPFWASGWMARGLNKSAPRDYATFLCRNVSRDALVFLNFGMPDIDFALRRKVHFEGYFDIPRFIHEMISGVQLLYDALSRDGFSYINFTFTSPPSSLSSEYWYAFDQIPQIPTRMRGAVLADFANFLSENYSVVSVLDDLCLGGNIPFLRPEMMRDYPDHHPDYTKTQEIVLHALEKKFGDNLLRPRPKLLDSLYPHDVYSADELIASGEARPRTCGP